MAKHIQFSAYGSADVLSYADFTPPPLADNEVIVANKAIGVNYIDTYVRSGLYPAPQLPTGLGTEAAGVILDIGANVKHLNVGDRVAYCQSTLGAYSEIHHINAAKVVKLPDNISFEQAAACLLKGLTVYYLLHMTYPVQANQTIVFHAAAGGVGQIACQWAKALGVKLIGCVGSEQKAAVAQRAGAWATINYQHENIPQRVFELTEGDKVPVVYDSVGQSTWLTSLDCLQPRGLMVSFGNASGPVTNIDLGILNKKGALYVTRPSLAWYMQSRETLELAANALFEQISRGIIQIEVPEQQRFALRDAAQAHKALESRQTIGSCLLIP